MLPILYQSPNLILYSYPLFMGLGWGLAYQLFRSCSENYLSVKNFYFLFVGVFLSAWLGAKLMFLITAPHDLTYNLSTNLSFWMGGGFVFYGGFILALVYVYIFHKLIFPIDSNILWAMVTSLSFGHGIGRIGCLLAGCCYGEITSLPWGIYLHDHYRHPTQILESVGLLGLGFFLLRSNRSRKILVIYYLVFYGILRIGIELLRGDVIRGQWFSLSPSIFISFIVILAGGLSAVFVNKINPLGWKK